MKTVYLQEHKGRVKVIQKGSPPPPGGTVYEVRQCRAPARSNAQLCLEYFKQAQELSEDQLESLLDIDEQTYSTLKRALRRVSICE